jgi:hypothetical protein
MIQMIIKAISPSAQLITSKTIARNQLDHDVNAPVHPEGVVRGSLSMSSLVPNTASTICFAASIIRIHTLFQMIIVVLFFCTSSLGEKMKLITRVSKMTKRTPITR